MQDAHFVADFGTDGSTGGGWFVPVDEWDGWSPPERFGSRGVADPIALELSKAESIEARRQDDGGSDMRPDVAALYVLSQSSGYAQADGVDLWPESRDARLYSGPGPVVAHPPCAPWARKIQSMIRSDYRAVVHLAPCAVLQVRRFGGILEHPANSMLWDKMRLPRPLPMGSLLELTERDSFGGFSVEVELSWWGSPLRKPTWLYFVGIDLDRVRDALPKPCAPAQWRGKLTCRTDNGKPRTAWDMMGPTERKRTPPAMAQWLVDLARTANVEEGPSCR